MSPWREIVDGVFLIDTLAGGVPGLVASYLVKGEESAFVDVGYATSAGTVLSELQALDSELQHVQYLIPTHVHLDHAGAVGHLVKAMPDARVLVNEHGVKHMVDPTKLIESASSLFGKEALSVFGAPIPVPRERIEVVRDQYNLDLGAGRRLRIFWTPGHAPHHMSILLEGERLLVTGDAVGLLYPGFDTVIPSTPPPSFDEDQYVKTITRIKRMNLAGLLLPHFGPLLENTEVFLQTNLETIMRWRSMVLEAVKASEPLNRVFEAFMADVAKHTGKSQDEIPDHVTRSVLLSATGYYSYAQKTTSRQCILTMEKADLVSRVFGRHRSVIAHGIS